MYKYFFYIFFLLAGNIAVASEPEYLHAIINTAVHKNEPISQSLTVIQGPIVRMTTFTTYDGYKTTDKTLGATIWVTVDPEIKKLCSQYVKKNKVSHEQLAIWLAQLLGLPSDKADKRRFVVLDVPVIQAYYGAPASTIGIFRPCTDPRIGIHQDGSAICPKKMSTEDSLIASDFKTWFINNSIGAYNLENGAPWTEYGFTYNWNPQAENIFGVSEFVVLKNTPISVVANPLNSDTAYITPEQYCG